ncbi:hypothetical protein [Geminocystis sp. NIES-3709]|uniref:hypothetical protein n=1 Tax=Geminocystis sp. NIES-3709 TaxID=1617448 RepID=UPI0005FCC943|nr:hypothetical protein [Geminocystis sp. NIES-3709]BAQ67090.1 hypothetical protein GM3709_3855 [Geminocystis sp. NIES-3709]
MKLYSISYTQQGQNFQETDYYDSEEVVDKLKELVEEGLENFELELIEDNDDEE